jgi:subtilisin family serine protease
LEDRFCFSTTPLQLETVSLSNATPEGAAAILAREIQWALVQAANSSTNQASGAASQSPEYSIRQLPNDPLFPSQWHLLNTGQVVSNPDFTSIIYGVAGQDANVVPAWELGYTGEGIIVAVIDTGVEIDHPDLADNIHPTLRYNAIDGTSDVAPDFFDPGGFHGTSVAGLIGAVWNNLGEQIVDEEGEPVFDEDGNPVYSGGVAGVSPNVTLVPIKLVTNDINSQAIFDAFLFAIQNDVDITNNSWGPSIPRFIQPIPTIIDDNGIPHSFIEVLRDSVVFGRDGLGMIHVWASGNDGGPGQLGGGYDSASYDAFSNSRYVISVTGIDHDGQYRNSDGTFTSYPESGPDVLVAAPTGSNVFQNVAEDTGQGSGMWTTDLTGDQGLNAPPLPSGFDNDRDFLPDPDYTSRMNGTSSAAPVVSGVVALMLEANPNLTYRDVQEILVRSARTTAWYESPSAPTNINGGSSAGLNGGATGSGTSSSNSGTNGTTGDLGGGIAMAVVEDWGDAPAPYPTVSAQNGARHQYDDSTNLLTLGAARDAETNGQPDLNALGDDNTPIASTDDEDGVVFPVVFGTDSLRRGTTETLSIEAPGGGVLNAWIDYDGDGSWSTSERVIQNLALSPGTNSVPIAVPANAVLGQTFARFRLTSQTYIDFLTASGQQLLPTGLAPEGEVEDHEVEITDAATTTVFGLFDFYTTWQMNQTGVFRDPDTFFHTPPGPPPDYPATYSPSLSNPLALPAVEANFPDSGIVTGHSDPDRGNDFGRQVGSHYELMPGLFSNGAGYTVSQGYGRYADQVGYAHGVVDAGLAVQMARQWHTLGQNIAPDTERTYTTFIQTTALNLPAAEEMANNGMLVPGGIGGDDGFIGYWNEYNAQAPGPFDPASPQSWPNDTRGFSYIDFVVPAKEQINVESVEVKLTISGAASNLDFLRMMLTSPDGTQSELNHYYEDPSFIPNAAQVLSNPQFTFDPAGDITTGTFEWTFSTNRNWGESTNGAVILNPITGEPVEGPGGDPIIRNWEIHIENWGAAPMVLGSVEIVWHGKQVAAPSQYVFFDPAFPNAPGIYRDVQAGQNAWDQRWLNNGTWQIPMAQRIQGSIGIDANGDNDFNFDRYVQEINAGSFSFAPYDSEFPRSDSIIRRPDFTDVNANGVFDSGTDVANQEEFAENIVVSLYRVDKVTGQVDLTPTSYFLTGADGNFYFDVDPTYEWVVRIDDPFDRDKLNDGLTGAQFMKHYQSEWRITPDWFFAPDRVNDFAINPESFVDPDPALPGDEEQFKPGEVFWGANDANGDGVSTIGPMPFINTGLTGSIPVPMAVKNVNFLLKAEASPEVYTVAGSVFADLNNNSVFDGDDARMPNITVYWDVNRNGAFEASEPTTVTNSNGDYTLQVSSTTPGTFSIGVRLPGSDWQFKQPADGVADVTLPNFPVPVVNFALTAPSDAFPDNPPPGALGRILGIVFNDLDKDGVRDQAEPGQVGVRIFIDANGDNLWQATEASAITASNGSFVLDNVPPGLNIRVDVHIENEGTPAAPWSMTTPTLGYRLVSIGTGGTATGVVFGVENRADNDWGDLPISYDTLGADNGPSHFVSPGVRLGATVDGEVDGVPTPGATGDTDDGVSIVGNGGVLVDGVNTLRVTVFGVGGLLTGWIDFNNDGQFTELERLNWTLAGTNLGGEADLNPGTWDLQINVPSDAANTALAARFRWGEQGLTFTGPAVIGEVEDYFFNHQPLAGDYDQNGTVDQGDYLVWRMTLGQNVAPYSGADGSGNGVVDQADFNIWRANFGKSAPIPGGGAGLAESGAGDGASSAAFASPEGAPAASGGATNGTVSNSLLLFAMGGYESSSVGLSTFAGEPVIGNSPAVTSDDNLLLLDAAWADLSESAETDDYSLTDDVTGHDDLEDGELELAAALFDEQTNWWEAL